MKIYSNKTFRAFPFIVHLGSYFAGGTEDTLKCFLIYNLLSVALEEQRV
jgi:predicted metalloprotease with PDZ domain